MFRTLSTALALTVIVFVLLPDRSARYAIPSAEIRDMLETTRLETVLAELEKRIQEDPQNLSLRRELVLVQLLLPPQTAVPLINAQFAGDLGFQELDHSWFYSLASHPDANVRTSVAAVIGASKLPGGLQTAKKLAYDQNLEVRAVATRTLGLLGSEEAYFTLLLAMKDGDWNVRSVAAEAAAYLPADGRTLRALFRVAKDMDEYVRNPAERSLMRLYTPEHEKIYRENLKSDSRLAQQAAALALLRAGDRTMAERLQKHYMMGYGKDRELIAMTLARYAPNETRQWMAQELSGSEHDEERKLLISYLDGKVVEKAVAGADVFP